MSSGVSCVSHDIFIKYQLLTKRQKPGSSFGRLVLFSKSISPGSRPSYGIYIVCNFLI
jgi:hypothetical protein